MRGGEKQREKEAGINNKQSRIPYHELTVFPGDEPVDLRHGHNVRQHIAEPLGVYKVEMAECWCGIVQHYP